VGKRAARYLTHVLIHPPVCPPFRGLPLHQSCPTLALRPNGTQMTPYDEAGQLKQQKDIVVATKNGPGSNYFVEMTTKIQNESISA